MDAWTFIWLMLLLKIPIVALFLIVRWAVRQTPDASTEGDGGIGVGALPAPGPTPVSGDRRTRHPRPPLPRHPRRGPHGGSAAASPARIRTVTRARATQR